MKDCAMIHTRVVYKILLLYFLILLLSPHLLLAENIPLTKKGGVYEVPVEVNGVIKLNFILDTGASEVNIPADVALTLYRTGTIRETDFLPGQTYRLADGSILQSSRFLLQSLKIGNRRIANVPASIGSASSPLLLGQNFLEKLGAWGIDSQKQVLTIRTKVEKEASTSKQPYIPKNKSISIPEEVDLDKVFIKGDQLSYAGYEIGRSLDREKNEYVLTIKKNRKILVNINSWWDSYGDMTKIGVFPLLGKENKQLLVMQYSGGSGGFHTCKIYDLVPNIRVIHDDEEYSLFGGISIIDINKDNKYEIVRRGNSFRTSYMANVDNVYPTVILSYNMNIEKYVIENKSFPDYILANIEYDINKFNSMDLLGNIAIKGSLFAEYTSAMLEVVVNYIYSGKEKEGWDFFSRRYKLPNKEEVRSDIIKRLNNDPVYKEIYGR